MDGYSKRLMFAEHLGYKTVLKAFAGIGKETFNERFKNEFEELKAKEMFLRVKNEIKELKKKIKYLKNQEKINKPLLEQFFF